MREFVNWQHRASIGIQYICVLHILATDFAYFPVWFTILCFYKNFSITRACVILIGLLLFAAFVFFKDPCMFIMGLFKGGH